MREYLTIHHDEGQIDIDPNADQDANSIRLNEIGPIKKVEWYNAFGVSLPNAFFWMLRRLNSKLTWGGEILLHVEAGTEKRYPFPVDTLGALAIVNPVAQPDGSLAALPNLLIEGVHRGGIAERAGIKVGDILHAWDEERVGVNQQPWKSFQGKESGEIRLNYEREGQHHDVVVACNKPWTQEGCLVEIGRIMSWTHLGGGRYRKEKPQLSDDPLVSILMHAYKPDFFEEALSSALTQTYANIEIIIGDDNAKGEIRAIVDRLAKNDPRIRYELNDPPLRGWGAGNRYRCFERANGELIKYLCDDDVLMPDCVEKMVAALRLHPEASLVISHTLLIDEKSRENRHPGPTMRRFLSKNGLIDGMEATNLLIGIHNNMIGVPSDAMFRRSHGLDQGLYVDAFCGVEAEYCLDDINLWAALLMKGDLAYIAKPLTQFRVNEAQGSLHQEAMLDFFQKFVRFTQLLESTGSLRCSTDFQLKRRELRGELPRYGDNDQLSVLLDRPETLSAFIGHDANPKKMKILQQFIQQSPHWPQGSLLFLTRFPNIRQRWEKLPDEAKLKSYRNILEHTALSIVQENIPAWNQLLEGRKCRIQFSPMNASAELILAAELPHTGPIWIHIDDGREKNVQKADGPIVAFSYRSLEQTDSITLELNFLDESKAQIEPNSLRLIRYFF